MTRLVCWVTRRRLGAYQDGELAPGARARTAAHLARCRDCAAELAALGRLRTALQAEVAEPPEAVWETFWPQVEARLPAPPLDRRAARLPTIRGRGFWEPLVGHPRLALGSAVAAAAVAVLAVVAPWEGVVRQREAPPIVAPGVAPGVALPGGTPPDVASVTSESPLVVQAVETADPDSSVMVFTNEDPGVTVVWVFGLQRT